MTNDELLHKWVNRTISERELEIFKLRPEYDSLMELYQNTANFSAPNYDAKKMLSEIILAGKLSVSKEKKGRRIFLASLIKYGVAASILIFAGWYFWLGLNNTVVYELAKGERQEGTLPDGSLFVLNAESSLTYHKKSWAKERTLDLDGEAFFQAEKGSKFTVKTPSGNVEVLGTKFNVWSRDDILEVKCQSGKVKVVSIDGTQINELSINDAIRLVPGKAAETWEFQSTDKASWVEGISKFKSVEISIVLNELERQFDIEIDAGAINIQEIISCNFSHEDLELALKTALGPLGIQYETRDEKKVYLYN